MPKEEEWNVVRRRRGTSSSQAFQELVASKRLAIPVVACAFSSLREDDPDEIIKKQKRKEKKLRARQNKQSKKAENDDDEDEEEPTGGAHKGSKPAATSPVASKSTSKAAPVPRSLPAAPDSRSWLYKVLCAVLLWLEAILGLTKPKKRKRPAQPQPAAPPAAPAAAPAATPAAASARAISAPASTPASATPSKVQTTPARAPVAATPANKPAPPPVASTPAATPATQPAAAAKVDTAATNNNTTSQAANRRPPPETKPAPPPPTGPATKCDREWARGRFVVSSQMSAHADVVSSVALSGSLGLTAGYDGSLKLWRIKSNGRTERVKNLAGHTGRVEAVAAHADSMRAASTGRDSSLKVWSLGSADDMGGAAQELTSLYVYESVKSMVVNWGSPGGALAALGARSGKTSLFNLDTGKRLSVLKGQGSEVVCLNWGGHSSHQHMLMTGSAGGAVSAWDVRVPGAADMQPIFSLQASRGKICSLDMSDTTLYVGDYSTSVKTFDLRMLLQNPDAALNPTRLANAPVFAGDACPMAGLSYCPAAKVLLSSGIAWWTDNWKALEESGPEADTPAALLNVYAVDSQEHEYMYTVRLGAGIVTSMDWQGDRGLLGTTTGSLFSVRLLRGATNKVTESLDAPDHMLSERLDLGCEEHSEDEDSDDEDEED